MKGQTMLVRLLEYNYETEDKYANPHFIKAYNEPNYEKFVIMLNNMENRDFRVGDEWYTFQEWLFSFPKDEDCIPSIDIYVCSY